MEEVDFVDLRGETVKLQLHKAASASDLKKLLGQAKDHNALDANGDAPLHCFTKRKDREKFNCLMTLLIHSKCDVNLPNKDGQTALHLACQSNDTLVLKALIAFDAKINTSNVNNKTPLDIVLQSKDFDLDTAHLLIQLGAMTHKQIKSRFWRTSHNFGFRQLHNIGKSDSMLFRLDHKELKGPTHNIMSTFSRIASSPSSTIETTDGIEDEVDLGPLELEQEEENKTGLPASTVQALPVPDSEQNLLKEIEVLRKKYGSRSDSLSHSEGARWSQSEVNPEMEVMDSVIGESVVPIEHQNVTKYPPERMSERLNHIEHCARSLITDLEVTQRGRPSMERETQQMEQQSLHQRVRSRPTKGPRDRRPPPPPIFHVSHVPRTLAEEESPPIGRLRCRRSPSHLSEMPRTIREGEHLKEKGQRILFLDGGGIKGLIQIEMLKTIEQMTGKSISELFDWVVGTSTGGILALGMIYGNLSLIELRRLYFEMKDTVFKQQSNVISHVCDTNALESLLKRMLGTEIRMDFIKKPHVLIAAVNKSTTDLPVVFFNNCLDYGNERSVRNELVWKVARYTSAAPVFFTEHDNYVDGGVKANNPTSYGLAEILEYLSKKYGRWSEAAKISCVVSLGCGIYPPEPLGNTDIADALKITKLLNIPDRLENLLTLLTAALNSSDEISRLCRINCEHQGIAYFRFNPKIDEEVGTTEKDNEKLCQIIIKAKQLFREHAKQVEKMIQQLRCEIREDYLYLETIF